MMIVALHDHRAFSVIIVGCLDILVVFIYFVDSVSPYNSC